MHCLLQVLYEYFAPGERSAAQAAQQQVKLLQKAMLLKAWVIRLPEILAVIDQYDLNKCQGAAQASLQTLLEKNGHQLLVKEVPQHLAAIEGICGRASAAELELFNAVKHCDAFFNFLKQQQFFGK